MSHGFERRMRHDLVVPKPASEQHVPVVCSATARLYHWHVLAWLARTGGCWVQTNNTYNTTCASPARYKAVTRHAVTHTGTDQPGLA